MGRFVVIILDSFGVGAMKDVPTVRPRDIGANTAWHILEKQPHLQLPILEKLGLMNAVGKEMKGHYFSETSTFGVANLAHEGADSFLGHQEIMGTTPKKPLKEPFQNVIETVHTHLLTEGYQVRKVGKAKEPSILVVNECAVIGDNLETDLGQVYNVSACLDDISFEDIQRLGRKVREVVKVSRVIAFGGRNVTLQDLLDAREIKKINFAGINTPKSGLYQQDYHVIHLGYGIDPAVQLPTILDQAGVTVSLLGKVADIVQTSSHRLFFEVDTRQLFQQLTVEIKGINHGFICLNIQETDLAGHEEDVERYGNRLALCDQKIGELLPLLNEEDILIVMADHGNDPTIGHSNHTREKVPLLVYRKKELAVDLGERATLADVAATATAYFSVRNPQNGDSFLHKIL